MLRRFCAYGFLKNQRYFEPFLVLAFLEHGLDFFAIGVLIAIRELTVNVTEVLSGAFADVYGRRLSMVASFMAYIGSFLLFGLGESFPVFAVAMVLYGVGDAFRTGTHKAMIFTWLRLEGRSDERTAVYGTTRSWSKLGSALSVVIGAILVFALDNYTTAFFLAVVPYGVNIANLATYPRRLDATTDGRPSIGAVVRRLRDTFVTAARSRPLRSLLVESMGFEGSFNVAKDYLQPVLKSLVLGTAAFAALDHLGETQRVALIVGPVYFLLFLASAWASRNADAVRNRFDGEARASTALWVVFGVAFATMLGAGLANLEVVLVLVFMGLFVVQNFWRPILIARFDDHTTDEQQATMLSVEHQAKSLAAMVAAPIVGWAVDATGSFWPIGALGLVALAVVALMRLQSSP